MIVENAEGGRFPRVAEKVVELMPFDVHVLAWVCVCFFFPAGRNLSC